MPAENLLAKRLHRLRLGMRFRLKLDPDRQQISGTSVSGARGDCIPSILRSFR
jgi:hypothetical protein